MIRKYILWLWIWLLAFLWFTSANSFIRVWDLGFYPNYYDSNYWNSVLKRWRLLSNYLWTSKEMFAFWNKNFVFWNNWQLYLYDFLPATERCWSHLVQWYFNMVRSCPVINNTWDFNIWNCGEWSSYSSEIVWNFLKTLKQWDWFYYDRSWSNEWYCRGFRYNTYICFSSSEIWNTLCFYVNHSPEWSSTTPQPFYWLWESLWFNDWLTYWLISNSYLEVPPLYTNNIDWSSNTSENISLSWNLLYNKCTNWYVINKIRSVYWSEIDRVCYAWTIDTWLITSENVDQINSIFHWTPKQWLDFKMLYQLTNNWESRNNWFRSNEDAMLRFKQWRVWVNPFIWSPIALYSYFDILFNNWNLWRTSFDDGPDWMGPYFILNYCKLSYTDLDSEYKWSYFSSYCSDLSYSDPWQINDEWTNTWSWQVENDDEVLPPWFDNWNNNVTWSWTAVSVDWSWVLSWWNNQNYDWITFINDMYQKLQQNFLKPYNNVTWIIPWYILVFLFALILFRFLQH